MNHPVYRLFACLLIASIYFSCETTETTQSGEDNIQTEGCVIDPELLDFGGIVLGQYTDLSAAISIKGEPLDTIETVCPNFSFIDPISGDPTDILFTGNLEYYYDVSIRAYKTDVEIRFSPQSVGEKSCNFTFSHTSDETVHLCPVLIAEGVGIVDCGFNPSYLDFPTTTIGSPSDLDVTLFVVAWPPDNPTIASDDFRFIDPITMLPATTLDFSDQSFPYDHNEATGVYSTELTIRFDPQTAGTKDCDINIVKTGDNPYDCPTLSLHGLAIDASGGEWLRMQPTSYDLYDVYGNASEVFACGDVGTVIRHTHGDVQSTVWMEEDFGEIPLDAIWVDASVEPNTVWVGGGEVDGGYTAGKVYGNNDGSTTWIDAEHSWMLDMVSAIWGSATCDMYMGGPAISGTMPTLYLWDCSELTGEFLGMGYEHVTGIHGSGPEDIWATMDFYQYNAYHYDGVGWALLREEWMDQPLYDVWVAYDGRAWAVGANGAIYHWSGIAWSDQSISDETRTFYGIWGLSSGDIYAVGADGLFYHYTSSWEEITIPSGPDTETFYAVWGKSAPKYIYAVGTNGTILRYSP